MNGKLIAAGLICSLLWGFITAMTLGLPIAWCQFFDQITFQLLSKPVYQMANGFYYDVNNNDMPTVIFIIIFFTVFVLYFLTIHKIEQGSTQKYSLGIIIFFSILFRIILLPGELIHENDIYRYIWDGKSFNQRVNPYKFSPSDLFMYQMDYNEDYYDSFTDVILKAKSFSPDDRIALNTLIRIRDQNPTFYNRIGHWQVPTIYPPVAQLLFAVPAVLKIDSIIVMKSLFVFFDIGVIFLIVALLRCVGLNPNMCLIYGWSPLVLKEFPNSGHYDAIPIFFMLAGIYLLFKKKSSMGLFALSFATLSKFFAVILLPLFRGVYNKRSLILFILSVGLFYLPFVLWSQTGILGVFQGFITYNQHWFYNASIFAVINNILIRFFPHFAVTLVPAKMIVGLLYLATISYLTFKRGQSQRDLLHKCFLALGILFLLNPVCDPWYFIWVMPFLCFFPSRSWLLLPNWLHYIAKIGN